jgi:PBP1b-binding outer membrane lipoprotein LpoB
MYGRNCYASTKYASQRTYGFSFIRAFIDLVQGVDRISKTTSKSFTENIGVSDTFQKTVVKILTETLTLTDLITTELKSSFRKTRATISSFFTRGTIRKRPNNTRIR